MGDGRHNSAHHETKQHKHTETAHVEALHPAAQAQASFCSEYLDELKAHPLTAMTDTEKMGHCFDESKTAAGKQMDKAKDAAVDAWHTYQVINPLFLGATLMKHVSDKLNEITEQMPGK